MAGNRSNGGSGPEVPWIEVAPEAPYFQTETGESWTPVGQNDAVSWPELAGAFRRRDLAAAEAYVAGLAASGVTCMRLMLEYSQVEHRYLEGPPGSFRPQMVRLWDDLFALCTRHGVRILLTPFDTFWMWRRWSRHPYNRKNGGVCGKRSEWTTCRETRAAIQRRLRFATERWGGSGTLFAWDLWNELHPAHGGGDCTVLGGFVDELADDLRRWEIAIHGRAHPQTVSVFGPILLECPELREVAFRHPKLDFHSTHFYEQGTIDHPRNTVDAAVSVGRLVRQALAEVGGARPFLDSEHGPIHTFKDHRRTLPAPFDDEYFRHIQWAHLASGAAGGGMRWPNRSPHSLTPGMRAAQKALAGFLPLVDWTRFRRRNLNQEIGISGEGRWAGFACADAAQAVAWLLRTDRLDRNGMLRRDAEPAAPTLALPGLAGGRFRVTVWDTAEGRATACFEAEAGDGKLAVTLPPTSTDAAVAVRRL
jgi:hypothetical protein